MRIYPTIEDVDVDSDKGVIDAYFFYTQWDKETDCARYTASIQHYLKWCDFNNYKKGSGFFSGGSDHNGEYIELYDSWDMTSNEVLQDIELLHKYFREILLIKI